MKNSLVTAPKVSLRNQEIALWLIEKYEIQQGYDLDYYLKVPYRQDNFTAVCLWVERQSRITPKRFETLGDLARGFLNTIPQHLFE